MKPDRHDLAAVRCRSGVDSGLGNSNRLRPSVSRLVEVVSDAARRKAHTFTISHCVEVSVDADLLEQVRGLEGDFNFEMYFSLSCHNCPDVVQALTLLALENSRVTATLIEGGTFQDEVEARDVMAVPATFLNGEPFYNGKLELAEILAKIDTASEAKAADPHLQHTQCSTHSAHTVRAFMSKSSALKYRRESACTV